MCVVYQRHILCPFCAVLHVYNRQENGRCFLSTYIHLIYIHIRVRGCTYILLSFIHMHMICPSCAFLHVYNRQENSRCFLSLYTHVCMRLYSFCALKPHSICHSLYCIYCTYCVLLHPIVCTLTLLYLLYLSCALTPQSMYHSLYCIYCTYCVLLHL